MAKMAENGKMADWSFELFYCISADKHEYRLHFDVSDLEMTKNDEKWPKMAKNGKMAENGQKWRMGHLNFFIVFLMKKTNMDSILTYLVMKWPKMAENGKMAKWPKWPNWQLEHLKMNKYSF